MKVLVTETLDPVPAQWLADQVELVWCSHNDPGFPQQLARAEGLVVRTYTQVNEQLLTMAPHLKVVGRAGVGLDNIDLAACRRRGVEVVYTPDANTQAVIEYVFGLILDQVRPRTSFSAPVTDEQFHHLRKTQVGKQLDQLTLGIVGFGRIGKRMGQVATAIGMNVMVNDLLPEAGLRKLATYPFEYVDKQRLYAHSDIVTIHVDGRPENRDLINAEALAQLKPGCMLINAARGMVVDTQALAEWARANADQGSSAVLDVHDPEPPGPDYPLYNLANVRLLPHLASRTREAMENMSWVVRDVLRVLQGHKPEFPA